MLRDEQPELIRIVTSVLAEYVKAPTPAELEAWWLVCRVFSLADVERVLKAHAMDADEGKRAPRPVDVKRRLSVPQRDQGGREFEAVDESSERMRSYREACIKSPSVRATAWAIALRHGNRPWQGTRFELPKD